MPDALSDAFTSIPFRIHEIIKENGLTPAAFADHIGISRAAINHILKGRNGPSRVLIARITSKYPEINTDWLLSGKSPKYKTEKVILQPDIFVDTPVESPKPAKIPEEKKYTKEIEVKAPEKVIDPPLKQEIIPIQDSPKKIHKIMILYSDNTFEYFSPEK